LTDNSEADVKGPVIADSSREHINGTNGYSMPSPGAIGTRGSKPVQPAHPDVTYTTDFGATSTHYLKVNDISKHDLQTGGSLVDLMEKVRR
jgi:hypothetical protein